MIILVRPPEFSDASNRCVSGIEECRGLSGEIGAECQERLTSGSASEGAPNRG